MQYYQSKDTNWELFFVLGSFKCVIWGMLKKKTQQQTSEEWIIQKWLVGFIVC